MVPNLRSRLVGVDTNLRRRRRRRRRPSFVGARTTNRVHRVHLERTACPCMQGIIKYILDMQRSLVTPRAQYINVCDYSFGFHGIRYKPRLTQDLTTFSTHRGNFKWLCASMGAASSPALYVEAMTNVLNEYGICAGSRSTGKHLSLIHI